MLTTGIYVYNCFAVGLVTWTYRLLFAPFCAYLVLCTAFTAWALLALLVLKRVGYRADGRLCEWNIDQRWVKATLYSNLRAALALGLT